MKRVFTISRALVWSTAILITLSACATVSGENDASLSPAVEKSRDAERSGNYAVAARAYLAAAAEGDEAQRVDYVLDAAEAFYRGQLMDQAKHALQSLPGTKLQPPQLARRQRLTAALAVAGGGGGGGAGGGRHGA